MIIDAPDDATVSITLPVHRHHTLTKAPGKPWEAFVQTREQESSFRNPWASMDDGPTGPSLTTDSLLEAVGFIRERAEAANQRDAEIRAEREAYLDAQEAAAKEQKLARRRAADARRRQQRRVADDRR